jgi:hypothetical protein
MGVITVTDTLKTVDVVYSVSETRSRPTAETAIQAIIA